MSTSIKNKIIFLLDQIDFDCAIYWHPLGTYKTLNISKKDFIAIYCHRKINLVSSYQNIEGLLYSGVIKVLVRENKQIMVIFPYWLSDRMETIHTVLIDLKFNPCILKIFKITLNFYRIVIIFDLLILTYKMFFYLFKHILNYYKIN